MRRSRVEMSYAPRRLHSTSRGLRATALVGSSCSQRSRSTVETTPLRSGVTRPASRPCAVSASLRAARALSSISVTASTASRPRLTHVKRVYLDHAATTPVDPEVADAMARALREVPGNPSSIYAEGRAARELVDRARDAVDELARGAALRVDRSEEHTS